MRHAANDFRLGLVEFCKPDLGATAAKWCFVPQSVNSTFDPCCTLHEWLVFPLRGSTKFYARAAFSTLRVHAAGKPNSQNGLRAGLSCATHRCRQCGAISTGQRNTCIETLCGSFVSQRHTWSFVELSCDGAQLCLTMYRKIRAFWEVLS